MYEYTKCLHATLKIRAGKNMPVEKKNVTQTHMLMSWLSALGEPSELRRGEPGRQCLYCFTLSPSLLTAQNTQRSTSTKPGASSRRHNTHKCQRASPQQPPHLFVSNFPKPPPCLVQSNFCPPLRAEYSKSMLLFQCRHARKSLIRL